MIPYYFQIRRGRKIPNAFFGWLSLSIGCWNACKHTLSWLSLNYPALIVLKKPILLMCNWHAGSCTYLVDEFEGKYSPMKTSPPSRLNTSDVSQNGPCPYSHCFYFNGKSVWHKVYPLDTSWVRNTVVLPAGRLRCSKWGLQNSLILCNWNSVTFITSLAP